MYANHARKDSAVSVSIDDKETEFSSQAKSPFFSRDFKDAENSFSSAVKKLATISDECKWALLEAPFSNVPGTLAGDIWDTFEAHTKEKKSIAWNFVEFGSGHLPVDVCRFADIPLVSKTAIKDRVRSSLFGKREWLHANEINFASGHNFIASQCPKKIERPGFLRMIAHYQVPLIVDLVSETDYASHLQDAYYGPQKINEGNASTENCPSISRINDYPIVQLLGQSAPSGLFVEHLNIADGKVKPHSVCRLHFSGWPDHGVISPATLRALANIVEKLRPQKSSPILVHCRAGVGRTGTLISFIAARDIIKKAINAGKPCNRAMIVQTILLVIAKGRLDRGPSFVQKGIQFKLIIDALMEETSELLGWENTHPTNSYGRP